MVAGSTPESFTSYDPLGRVKQTTQCNPGVTGCKTFTAAYDLLGDLTSLAYPSGFSVTYQYDSAARLYSATDSSGWNYASLVNTSQSYFLPAGAMGEIDTPNFKYTNSFNNRLQPTEIAAKMNVSGTLLLDKTYTYNPPNTSQVNNGNIYTVTNLKDSTRTQTFSYDALNRLATAQDAAHWSNVYTYDAWGNLGKKLYGPISAGEHMDTSADTSNHLGGYSYDTGGNMTGDGVNTYVYDAENRISSVAGVTYTYDADGRRVKKSSGTNYWYGPSGEALAETDSSGNWTNYIFFGGIRLARNVNGDIKYYISDHLHSTAVFADKTGTVLDDNDFYPWGGVVPGIGQTTSNNAIKFTGKYRDSESTLDYFGARYYANVMGRFMSPDWAARPVTVPYADFGDPQSLNLYAYVRNSPIIRVDLDGHDFINEGFQDWGFQMGDPRWGLAPQPEGDESQQQQQQQNQSQQNQPQRQSAPLNVAVSIVVYPQILEDIQLGGLFWTGVGTVLEVTFTDGNGNPVTGASVSETNKPPGAENPNPVKTDAKGTMPDVVMKGGASKAPGGLEKAGGTKEGLRQYATTHPIISKSTQTLTVVTQDHRSYTVTWTRTLSNVDSKGNLNTIFSGLGVNFAISWTTLTVQETK